MSVEALVIGGCADGKRVEVMEGQRRMVMSVFPRPCRGPSWLPADPVTFDSDNYRLEWIRSGERKFAMFIVDTMSHEEAMERLILGYKGKVHD